MAPFRLTYAPLGERNFRIFAAGLGMSLVGTWMQGMAFSWLVWTLTGSAVALGQVAAITLLPGLFLGPWAGVWADRLDRKSILMGAQVALMALAVILALLVQTGTVTVRSVYVIALLSGIARAIEVPAHDGMVGDLGQRTNVRSAVTLNAGLVQISRMAGPALAGVLMMRYALHVVFWLNAVSFLAALVALRFIQVEQVRVPSVGSALGDFMAAVRAVREHARLQDAFIASLLTTFFIWPIVQIMPAVADTGFGGGEGTFGFLLASSGAGALGGTLLVMPFLQHARNTGRVLISTLVAGALVLLPFAWTPTADLGAVLLFVNGLAVTTALATGLIQVLAPPGMRSRIMALWAMQTMGLLPIASYAIGLLAEWTEPRLAITLFASLSLMGGLLLTWRRPGLRVWRHAD
jgi:MFS family permease